MSEKNLDISDEIDDIIKNIENDVKVHKSVLADINKNANKILDMLEIQDENILEIKESQEHWHQIAENTRSIANAISQYGEQNLKLIDVIIGKKQVPVSVFILVVTILSTIALGLLVFFTGIKLKVNDIEISKGYKYGSTEN
jgi:hypothetical protein